MCVCVCGGIHSQVGVEDLNVLVSEPVVVEPVGILDIKAELFCRGGDKTTTG